MLSEIMNHLRFPYTVTSDSYANVISYFYIQTLVQKFERLLITAVISKSESYPKVHKLIK